jgi:hypothetical protein
VRIILDHILLTSRLNSKLLEPFLLKAKGLIKKIVIFISGQEKESLI